MKHHMFVIHYPNVSEDGAVMAAVTKSDGRTRFRIRLSALVVSDKDANWTRCTSTSSSCEWLVEMSEVERQLSGAIMGWEKRHADVIPSAESSGMKPVTRVLKNGVVFIMFRNDPSDALEYAMDDMCDFELELRDIRRSPKTGVFASIWRAVAATVRDQDVCSEEAEAAPEETADDTEESEELENDGEAEVEHVEANPEANVEVENDDEEEEQEADEEGGDKFENEIEIGAERSPDLMSMLAKMDRRMMMLESKMGDA